jgi:PTH1 family peptidyl-tRNA hydrolase
MKLIVGLGNPGSEYARTRHNVGFMAVDRLARRQGLDRARARFHAGVLEGQIAGQRAMIMQPTTYMNRSGRAVGEAVRFFKLDPARVMIVLDDTALPVGAIRIRPAGSAGSHNGMADIVSVLDTHTVPRLRIGIGSPQVDGRPITQHDYVLGRFTDEQAAELDPALDRVAEALACWVAEGIDAAMNRYNLRRSDRATDIPRGPTES